MSLEVSTNEFSLGDDERISINREITEGLLKKYPFALQEIVLPIEDETVAFFPGVDEDLDLEITGYIKDITRITHKDYGVIYENYNRAEEDVAFAFDHSRAMIFSDQGLLVFPEGTTRELFNTESQVASCIRTVTTGEKRLDGEPFFDCDYYPFGVGSLDKKEQKKISSILKINNKLNELLNDIKTKKQKENAQKNREMKENPKGFIKKILKKI